MATKKAKKYPSERYMEQLHRWVSWYSKKLKGVNWTKLKRDYGKPKAHGGGAGDDPPPSPKWPP